MTTFRVQTLSQKHIPKFKKEYGFELRKWSSSHREMTSSLPENLQEYPDKEKLMDENYKIKP